jgi:RIMS-binding protein 2
LSPNVETCNEELPFVEGQFIKIYGDQDSDGFYFGESQGKSGYVPFNMVSEVQVEDPSILQQLLNDINIPNLQKSKSKYNNKHQQQRDSHSKQKNVYHMIALYDYDPQALSPNADMDVI